MVSLGRSGLTVSKLGFGTVYFGVPSLHVSPDEGGRILVESSRLGVKFWDTSDDYGSHPHVASALRRIPRDEIVLSTKTSARSGREARDSFRNSLSELGTDYLDIFFLHAVASDWIDGCHRVLRELGELKACGAVKAIGLSTHSVAVVREASGFDELDVLMTICCRADQATVDRFAEHIPLEDGSLGEMLDAIKLAHSRGIGVIAMKVLGMSAPPLVKDYRSSIRSVAELDFVDAMLIGMKGLDEVRQDVGAILIG